VLYF